MDRPQDDYVVKEVPVFLCKTLESKLLLFKYPHQTKTDHGSRNQSICSGKIKLNSEVIELDCALNLTSEFYDTDRGKTLAPVNIETETSDNIKNKNGDLLNKITLRGESCITRNDIERYMIMSLFENKVYLNFLSGWYQFLPTHNHLLNNELSKMGNDRKRNNMAASTDEDDSQEEEGTALVPITVQFSQRKLVTKKSLREAEEESFRDYFSNLEQEPWINLKYFRSNSIHAANMKDQLCQAVTRDRRNVFQLTSKEFANIMYSKYTGEGTLTAEFEDPEPEEIKKDATMISNDSPSIFKGTKHKKPIRKHTK